MWLAEPHPHQQAEHSRGMCGPWDVDTRATRDLRLSWEPGPNNTKDKKLQAERACPASKVHTHVPAQRETTWEEPAMWQEWVNSCDSSVRIVIYKPELHIMAQSHPRSLRVMKITMWTVQSRSCPRNQWQEKRILPGTADSSVKGLLGDKGLSSDFRDKCKQCHAPKVRGEAWAPVNIFPGALTIDSLETGVPSVYPNAGLFSKIASPGTRKRLGHMSEHLNGTCTTFPLTCSVYVPALPIFTSWPCLLPPSLGVPHIPLAWVHLGNPHPLCPMIGFRSGSRNGQGPQLSSKFGSATRGAQERGRGNVGPSVPWVTQLPWPESTGLRLVLTVPSTGIWFEAWEALE